MMSPWATFCRCHWEKLKGRRLTDEERWTKTLLPQEAPHPGHTLSPSSPPPDHPPLFQQAPSSGRDSTLGTEGSKHIGAGAGQAAGTALHRHSDPSEPRRIFHASPCRPSGSQHWPQPGSGAQARRPAPRSKSSVFIFKEGCCPLRICPLEGSTCDRTPCPELKQDRRQLLAGDISKSESGPKSQVPRPPLPCNTQPGFPRLREGEGWGQAGSGGSQLRQPPAPDTPPAPLPGPPAS